VLDNREAVALIAQGQIDLKPVITDRIELAGLEPALQVGGKDPRHLKAVVSYEEP
jgi:threonine dehydrogenase-like Zn-dependent dehydrogenase